MNIWVLESDSGTKILYKSFLKTDADENIVSGFLTAFYHFSMAEFRQSLESIEMGGLRWIYILEPDYKLLFVAADKKNVKTELLLGRLNVIKEAFIKQYKALWEKKGKTWDGNLNVYIPFLKVLEDYYSQWEEVESITEVADFFDILGIFQQIFIMLRNIIENKMYSKSKNLILDRIEEMHNNIKNQAECKDQDDLKDITFSKESWINIIDINVIKCDKDLVIRYLKSLLREIILIIKSVKGKNLCYKYFNEEKIYSYLLNNKKLLSDLNLDMFLLQQFLLL
jgi:hypothetical protein